MKYVLGGIAVLLVLGIIMTQLMSLPKEIAELLKLRKLMRRQKECAHVWDKAGCRCSQCGYENHDWESYSKMVEVFCPHCGASEYNDCEFCDADGMINTLEYRCRCRKCGTDTKVSEN